MSRPSVQALDLPPEIWLKIGSSFRSDTMYYVGGCCAGPFRPSPGADTVGPLHSSTPPKDVINLSCVCRILRSMLEDDIKPFLSLCMQRKDDKLVHQRGSKFPNRDDKKNLNMAEIHEITALPLGNHILHLCLALREYKYCSFEDMNTLSQKYCDDAAPILYGTPRLQTLQISASFGSFGNDFDLSLNFCQALSSLTDLHTFQLRGLSIPAHCPMLNNVEHIQTDAKIYSFKPLPRLKDLRQHPDMFAPGYDIPSDVLARLEVLHYCSPDYSDERALLPQACRVSSLSFPVRQSHTEELAIRTSRI